MLTRFGLMLCLLGGGLIASPSLTAADKLNVLLIVADDLRPELGCYGSVAQTPHLDQLARRGIRFDRAYCQQAVCNPSRTSFLTGKRPDHTRVWSNGLHFRERNPDVVTLPQLFKQAGYETRDVGKIFHNWHTKVKGDRQSWSREEFLYYATHGDDIPLVDEPLPPNLALSFGRLYGQVPLCEKRNVPDEAYYDGRVANEAVRVLEEIKDRPFFLAVGFWKPHAPMNAPKKYWERYDAAKLPPLDPSRPSNAPDLAFHESTEILGPRGKQITLTPQQAVEMRHGYFANTSYMDEQVGKVLAALDKHGLTERTVIVFLSDHGYHLGEHGLWGKTSCFELDARVPLIIVPPKCPQAGQSTSALVELIDIYPTLAELCGLKPPKDLDGRSLSSLLRNPSSPFKSAALTQHPRPAYFDREADGVPKAMGYSLRTHRLRYTEWRDWNTGQVLARELYDHDQDPAELRNIIDRPRDEQSLKEAERLLLELVPRQPGKS